MTLDEKVNMWFKNPWMLSHRGFKVIENVYFVGNSWVSSYLLDTAKGLVLIDCAMQENLYQLVDEIYALGFDPHKIRYLLLSHGHFDHVGAARGIQELSGCETWLGKDDAFFYTERRDLIGFEDHVPEFKIDHFYDYTTSLDFGDIIVKPVHCPGHTPGTTSFFFDIHHEGKILTCGMHGGLGAVVLSKEALEASRRPLCVQQQYLDNLDKVMNLKVDVVIPSHAKHAVNYDFYKIADNDDGTGNGFIDPTAWSRMIQGKKQEMLKMMAEGR